MDSTGRIIHNLVLDTDRAHRVEGKLVVPIPAAELQAVTMLSVPARQAWYRARLAEQKRQRKAARKQQRAARKAGRK